MSLMLKHENRALRRAVLTIPALALVVLVVSFFASPLLQERLDVTRAFSFGSEQAAGPAAKAPVDHSAMERIPIFRAALLMYRDHPVNGVGVRAYPYAYFDYAEPGDVHVAKSDGRYAASHAHNIVLEVMADTGTIGLAGLALAFVFAFRHGRRVTPGERRDAFPFALAVFLIVFPLNSHFAIYGTYTSSLIWMLAGFWSASLRHDDR
jgi:O-antigen ligase